MELTFASYNIHKGVGRDGRRDPERILSVLNELNADIVALQEADRRFGQRETVLPRAMLDDHHWRVAPLRMRPASMGWHGNAVLVRPGIEISAAEPIALPSLEPRGAVCASLEKEGVPFCVLGTHLDLSGFARKRQVAAIAGALAERGLPAVLMGDFNEWSARGGALKVFGSEWEALQPGRSFPSGKPLAPLDRIVHSRHWRMIDCAVHHSGLASQASDHLPVYARLQLVA